MMGGVFINLLLTYEPHLIRKRQNDQQLLLGSIILVFYGIDF